MNIAESSNRVGQALRKIDEGKELLEIVKVIQDKSSPESWNNFLRLVIRNANKGLGYYYGISNTYYLLETNKEAQKVKILKKQIEEILSIPEYKRLVELGMHFGKALEELYKDVIAPTTPKNFGGTVAKPNLRRKIQDLYVSVQQTRIVKYFLTNLATNQKFRDISSVYESKRSRYPFSKKNRMLIRQLSKNDKELLNFLYFNELFSSVFDFMKRVIFETHLGVIIELNQSDIASQVVRTINKFGVTRINITEPLLINEGFVFRIVEPNTMIFGLFTNKELSFVPGRLNCKLSGYLYPQDDRGLFEL